MVAPVFQLGFALPLIFVCADPTGAGNPYFTQKRRLIKLPAMRPSQALHQHRDAVCLAAARYRAANPRVFGSAMRGDDRDGSDLDLLVDALPGITLPDRLSTACG